MISHLSDWARNGLRYSVAAVGLLMPTVVSAATYTWIGSGANANWSTKGNWSGSIAPVSGTATEIVLSSNGRTVSTNDIKNLTIKKLTLSGSKTFSIYGEPITFSGTNGILNSIAASSVTVTMWNNIVLPGGGQQLTIDCAGGGLGKQAANLDLRGIIAGYGGIWKCGAGAIGLYGNNTFTGIFSARGTTYTSGGSLIRKYPDSGNNGVSGVVNVYHDWALGRNTAYIGYDLSSGILLCGSRLNIYSNITVRTPELKLGQDRDNGSGIIYLAQTNATVASSVTTYGRTRIVSQGNSVAKPSHHYFTQPVRMLSTDLFLTQGGNSGYVHFLQKVQSQNQYAYGFYAPTVFHAQGNEWRHLQLRNASFSEIICATNNALPTAETSYLQFIDASATVDIGGFDQMIRAWPRLDVPTSRKNGFKSTKPAIVMFEQMDSGTCVCQFYDKAGIGWNPEKSGRPTLMYSNQVCQSQGELVVTNGYAGGVLQRDDAVFAAIRLVKGASFTSLGRIRLYKSRLLKVDDDGSGAGLYADEFISDYGGLVLPEGVELTCKRAVITDRYNTQRELAPGWYTKDDLPDTLIETDDACGMLHVWGDDLKEYVWTGNGADDEVHTDANWLGGKAPDFTAGNARLIFGCGSNHATVRGLCDVYGVTFRTNASFTVYGAVDPTTGEHGCLRFGQGGISNINTAAKGWITNTIKCGISYALPPSEMWTLGDRAVLSIEGEMTSAASSRQLKIWGMGTTKSTAGQLHLKGNSPEFGLPILITNAYVRVYTPNGLGSSDRRVFLQRMTCGNLIFAKPNAVNNVPLAFDGIEPWQLMTDSVDETFEQRGGFYNTRGSGSVSLGNYTFSGGLCAEAGSMLFSLPAGHNAYFTEKPFTTNPNGGSHLSFGGAGTYHLAQQGNTWTYNCFYNSSSCIKAECENAFYTNTIVQLGKSTDKTGTIDLNGYDQLVADIQPKTMGGSDDWTVTQGDAGYVSVTSEEPATLTMNSANTVTHAVKFSGKVGLTYAGTGVYTLANQVSDTTGDLTVSSGTLAFKWGAGWGNGNVFITGGTLQVDSTSADSIFGSPVRLEISGGTLQVDGTSTVPVRSLRVLNKTSGEMQFVTPGTYSAGNLDSYLSGTGKLRVLYDGTPGLCIIIR